MLKIDRIVILGYRKETYQIPEGSQVLSVSGHGHHVWLFLLIDPEAKKREELRVTVAKTGDPVEGQISPFIADNLRREVTTQAIFCGTYVSPEGKEHHVFVERPNATTVVISTASAHLGSRSPSARFPLGGDQ